MTPAPVTPAHAQVPSEPDAPVIVDFPIHALQVAYVDRQHATNLPTRWQTPGVYLLLGRADEQGVTPTYVGKSVDLRGRLLMHRSKPKIAWMRAMAVRRDTTDGFNSAEVGYLEGRVAAELDELPAIALHLEKKDLDTTLARHLLPVLDAFVPTILAAARLAGLDLATVEEPDDVGSRERKARQTFEGSVADLLAAGLLSAGGKLTCRRGGREATAQVTTLGELVVAGKSYSSPSTAAARGLGVPSANGWIAWRLEGGEGLSLAELRAQLPAKEVG